MSGGGDDLQRGHSGPYPQQPGAYPGGPYDSGPQRIANEPGRRGRRRGFGRFIGPLAGAAGLAVLLCVGVYALADTSEKKKCVPAKRITLNVIVAHEVMPAMKKIATRFNDERQSVGDRCVAANVKAEEPVVTSATVAGHGSKSTTTDVWIPDSSLWVALATTGKSAVRPTGTSLANSPVVAAIPRQHAAKFKTPGGKPTWDMLIKAVARPNDANQPKVRVQIPDPSHSAAGLGTLALARQTLSDTSKGRAAFTAITRSLHANVAPNTKALFARFERAPKRRAPMIVTSEQSVWAYNEKQPTDPAIALYMSEGLFNLDYPVITATPDPVKQRAAKMLQRAMATPKARADIQALGFRTPDGQAGQQFGGNSGLQREAPRRLPAPDPAEVKKVTQAWGKLTLDSRILALMDISGTMGEPFGTSGRTRLQGVSAVAQRALRLYPDDTDIGVWSFSSHLDGKRDYKEEVPIERLGTRSGSGSQRQAIVTALNQVRPKQGGDTGLYDSIQAAYREMKRGYKPDRYNYVIVFTDGVGNDDPAGGISLDGLLKWLGQQHDKRRPVAVIGIGVGASTAGRGAAMSRITKITGGGSYNVTSPEEIEKVFLDVVAQRLCQPKCPG